MNLITLLSIENNKLFKTELKISKIKLNGG